MFGPARVLPNLLPGNKVENVFFKFSGYFMESWFLIVNNHNHSMLNSISAVCNSSLLPKSRTAIAE
jgi:hypothetical protein